MIEVTATTSFGTFRIGKVYRVDETSSSIAGLLGVGYLVPTEGADDGDSAVHADGADGAVPVRRGDDSLDEVQGTSAASAGKGTRAPAKGKLRSEVNDGDGGPEPGRSDGDGATVR
jgi:hypothetical protein